jgi:hypothetical protein
MGLIFDGNKFPVNGGLGVGLPLGFELRGNLGYTDGNSRVFVKSIAITKALRKTRVIQFSSAFGYEVITATSSYSMDTSGFTIAPHPPPPRYAYYDEYYLRDKYWLSCNVGCSPSTHTFIFFPMQLLCINSKTDGKAYHSFHFVPGFGIGYETERFFIRNACNLPLPNKLIVGDEERKLVSYVGFQLGLKFGPMLKKNTPDTSTKLLSHDSARLLE